MSHSNILKLYRLALRKSQYKGFEMQGRTDQLRSMIASTAGWEGGEKWAGLVNYFDIIQPLIILDTESNHVEYLQVNFKIF